MVQYDATCWNVQLEKHVPRNPFRGWTRRLCKNKTKKDGQLLQPYEGLEEGSVKDLRGLLQVHLNTRRHISKENRSKTQGTDPLLSPDPSALPSYVDRLQDLTYITPGERRSGIVSQVSVLMVKSAIEILYLQKEEETCSFEWTGNRIRRPHDVR